MQTTQFTELRFSDLTLAPALLTALDEAQLERCTPIQAQTLPLSLAGADVAGQAQTGTGKTAAFLIATLNRLLTRPAPAQRRADQPRAVILAPTRELAVQIFRDAETIGRHSGLKIAVVYGGTGYEQQRQDLAAGVDLLIGTPGRLIDYYKQQVFDLKAVEVVVLDEADRMFDLGFIKDIRFILRRMPGPEQRLNMLFSATLSLRVMELAYEHMNNPQRIQIQSERITADRVSQVLYHVSREEKIALLLGLLRAMDPHRTLVFVNTRRAAERVSAYLEGNGVRADMLSGEVPQPKRLRLLKEFQEGRLPVLVATDVAARGLHIPDVSHVINFDLPQDAEDYVHRIGRTARLGASGDAISFACEEYVFSLPEIEQFIGHKLPVAGVDAQLLVAVAAPARRQPRRPPVSGGGGRPPRGRGPARQRSPA